MQRLILIVVLFPLLAGCSDDSNTKNKILEAIPYCINTLPLKHFEISTYNYINDFSEVKTVDLIIDMIYKGWINVTVTSYKSYDILGGDCNVT